eukprot:COSAG01_NODE_33551_length_562_cov_1.099352_1_plen_80_part_10
MMHNILYLREHYRSHALRAKCAADTAATSAAGAARRIRRRGTAQPHQLREHLFVHLHTIHRPSSPQPMPTPRNAAISSRV